MFTHEQDTETVYQEKISVLTINCTFISKNFDIIEPFV